MGLIDYTIQYIGSPEQPLTLASLIARRAEATPTRPFVIHEGVSVSYAEQQFRAEQAAAALASIGISAGDKVALMLANSLEFLDLWFGCALLGAVLVPVNTGLRGDGLRYIIQHSDSKVVVVDIDSIEPFERALRGQPGPEHRLVRGDEERDGWAPLAELLAGTHRPAPRAQLDARDLASVLYTSGTTGLPKGVMNSYTSYFTAAHEFTSRFVQARSDDVLYTSLPLFHVNAQMLTTVGSLVSGVPMVLARRFSASGFFDDMRDNGATVFNYIGAMLTMLYKQPENSDDANNYVRLAVGGAAPAELWPQFEARFGLQILEIYGLTETATFCIGGPPDDVRVGKIGLPVSWAEVRVAREDGRDASAGEPGQILIRSKRSDVLFRGYYKDDVATEAALDGGWFHSGDRGYCGDDGYFVFLDRLKDSIRRRGENISSFEVERVVNGHPEVAESAAIGVPSELGEEEVMIVVVPKAGHTPAPRSIVAFCEERMAAFMVPRFVQFRDELPKTATQRVQKFTLRAEGKGTAWDREVDSP